MINDILFYKCDTCNKVIATLNSTNSETICCNKNMVRITPKSKDEVFEKHLPNIKLIKDTQVKVSVSPLHPMNDSHYIEFIVLKTNKGLYLKQFEPSNKPIAIFNIDKDEIVIKAFEYCNIHGLYENYYEG